MLQSTLSGSSVPGLGGRERVKMMGGRYIQRTQQSALIGGVLEDMALLSVERCTDVV